MKPRLTVITLGVEDLDRSVQFYRDGLKLQTDGIIGQKFEYGTVAFFDLQAGLKLALWPRESIKHDTGLAYAAPNPTELTLGHNVSSVEEVDKIMDESEKRRRYYRETRMRHFLGRLLGIFPGSRWAYMGSGLEPSVAAY